MQEIKGKVNFNYRNQRNETLSAGRKAAIKRAWNDLQELKSTEIIKPPKKKGESKSHYTRRVRALKKRYGQSGNSLAGPSIAVPPGGKAEVRDGRIWIKKKGTDLREMVIPVNPVELAENTHDIIRDLVMQYKPDGIFPFHTHWRGNAGRMFFYHDSTMLEEDIEEFSQSISSILNQYKGNPHVMTGFILQWGTL